MPVSRAMIAAATGIAGLWRAIHPGLAFAHHKRRCCRALLLLHAGVWELAGVL